MTVRSVRHSVFTVLIPVAAILLAASAPVGAQTTASIFGTVVDQGAAAVPGVQVTATNVQTNESRSTTTNADGLYSFPTLSLGLYAVKAELTGFKITVREGIQLELNRNARVDIEIAVGNVVESVTIVADAPIVESTTNEGGAVIDQRRIVDLPISGRNTLSLVSLVPGAQPFQTSNAQGFVENRVSINGARQEDTAWLLDGGDNSSSLRNYGNDVPNPDAIQEFRVVTNNYGAEYGRAVGGVVNVVTKSGTNAFHGSLFEFFRNKDLTNKGYFDTRKADLRQNQYGGSLGGPVLRDKLFFFSTYQGFRREGTRRITGQVPTVAQRSGVFSRTITDPLTGQPFPGNTIPQDRWDPVAKNLLQYLPTPNFATTGPNGVEQTAGVREENQQILGKLDYLISANHKFSGAYFWSDSTTPQPLLVDFPNVRRDILNTQQNINLHEYWTIGNSKLNHVRISFARSAGGRTVSPTDVTLETLGGRFGTFPAGPTMFPSVTAAGYFASELPFGGAKTSNNYNLADTFEWQTGRHELKIGGEVWLRQLYDHSQGPAQGGSFTFDGRVTGDAFADFLLGRARTFTVSDLNYNSVSQKAIYGFISDRFRAGNKLVLNLGARYELNAAPLPPSADQALAYIEGRQSICAPQAPRGLLLPCDPGVPRAGFKTDKNDIAPRLGFAYDVSGDGKTVVRGGYGMSYGFTLFNALEEPQGGNPFLYNESLDNVQLSNPFATRPGGNPFPVNLDPTNLKFGVLDYPFVDFNLESPYYHQYNASFQRQLAADWAVDVAYVGNVGRNLLGAVDINSPARGTVGVPNSRRPRQDVRTLKRNGGLFRSSYNSLQAKLVKRLSQGYSILGSYTFGRALDHISFYNNFGQLVDQNNIDLNWGPADFDRRHTLVVSSLWEIPFFSKNRWLGGWAANSIFSYYSGSPLTVTSGRDNDGDGRAGDRANLVGDPNKDRISAAQAKAGETWFTTAAFVPNAPGQLGNQGRNALRGPERINLDLSLFKDFPILNNQKLQLRFEAFNVTNRVNLNNPNTNRASGSFGRIAGAGAPRTLQLGVKYLF